MTRTQTRHMTVRASDPSAAERCALASATISYPDRKGIASPWAATAVRPVHEDRALSMLAAALPAINFTNAYIVDVQRTVGLER